jgi:beta-lactamase superfamily II metal-dependent hydrolase
MVYDGGTKEYGADLVAHIRKYFGTNHVDYLVNSHPDNDHAGGLSYVIENMSVGEVWMHRPWAYSREILDYFHDGRITHASLAERLKDKMAAAYAMEEAAVARGVPVYEPFAGRRIGIFQVLSPTRDRYVHELVPAFEKSPELALESLLEATRGLIAKAMGFVAAKWHHEYLPENVTTSAENESSAILFARCGGEGYLLTGDAGVQSLQAAAAFALSQGLYLPHLVTFVQIPHHGGRHNVSTTTLNGLLGLPVAEGTVPTRLAYVSASANAPAHPKRVVTNAFKRRGFEVGQTKGQRIRHSFNMPPRADYGPLVYLPFYGEVEQ